MRFGKIGGAGGSGDGVGGAQCGGIGGLERGVYDLAQAALVEAGDVLVDGDDAVEVDRFLAVVGNDLDLRVVDDEPPALFLHFPVGDDLLAGGDDFRHERHVEPAAGDFPGTEDPAGAVHDDGLVEARFAEALGARVNHNAMEADGFAGGQGGEGVELAAVFVAFREMLEEIGHCGEPGGIECLRFLCGKDRERGEWCLAGGHAASLASLAGFSTHDISESGKACGIIHCG